MTTLKKTPLQLKQILLEHSLTQTALAVAMGWSPASVAQLINHQFWPKRQKALEIKLKIRAWLLGHGVSEATADTAFDFEGAEPGCANTPAPLNATAALISQEEEIMVLRKVNLTPTAKKAFALFRDPFDEVQDHSEVFVSPDIRYVREAMFQTARHGGFMAVVGESGAGKSTLRRDLNDRIRRESQPIIVVEPYVLGTEDSDDKGKTLKAAHLAEAIIHAVSPLTAAKASTEARNKQLHKLLQDSSRSGNRHVVIIEEAHSLPIPTLKHLKRFYELEDGFQKLLSIILVGQPELRLKLSESNPAVREVVQRCEVVELAPLDARLEEYLKFRFAAIGKPLNEVIDAGGIEAIRAKLTVSAGRRGDAARRDTVSLLYPLAVNNLMTAALNLAAEIGAPLVTADVVKEA